MSEQGRGLPTGGEAVGADLRSSGRGAAWGSLLSAQDFAAVTGVGFDPVGHVYGATVVHFGFVNRAGTCSGSQAYTPRTDLASDPRGPFKGLLARLNRARALVLSRAVEQCAQVGGDGIVGATMSVRPFPAGGTEFSLQGTAVRARGQAHLEQPFSSHVSAQEFARLVHNGWVPVSLVFGISLAARHDGADTHRQTQRLTLTNKEVASYSALVKDARRDARNRLHEAAGSLGADGIVVAAMSLGIGERECPAHEGERDHTAEAVVLGTAIASFDRTARTRPRAPLTIMRVSSTATASSGSDTAESTGTLPAVVSEEIPEGNLLDRYSARHNIARARRASRNPLSSRDTSSFTRKEYEEHE